MYGAQNLSEPSLGNWEADIGLGTLGLISMNRLCWTIDLNDN